MPRRRVRSARPPGGAGRRAAARHRGPQRRDRPGIAVRELAALRLRRRLHVRRRRADRRAPSPGPDPRPRPPPRAARPGGAARAPRSGGAGRPRAGAPGAGRGAPRGDRGRSSTTSCGGWATCRVDEIGAGRAAAHGVAGRGLAGRAHGVAQGRGRPDGRRGALDRDRGRGPLSRCASGSSRRAACPRRSWRRPPVPSRDCSPGGAAPTGRS